MCVCSSNRRQDKKIVGREPQIARDGHCCQWCIWCGSQAGESKRYGPTDVMWATKTLVGVESCSGVSAGNKRLRSIARHQNKMDPSKSAHWGALGPPNRTKYTSPIQQTCGFASWPGIPRLESIRIALWGPQPGVGRPCLNDRRRAGYRQRHQ